MDYKGDFIIKLRSSINELPVSEETKKNLLNCLQGPLAFYTFFPLDVLRGQLSFSQKYKEDIEKLSIYASFYVASVVLTDKIVDSEYDYTATVKNTVLEYLFVVKERAVLELGRLKK